MTEVFLSYAREDVAIARQVAERLREEGWSVFFDRDIPVGKTWEDVIEERLSRATCVVVLWSSASIKSDWVRAEAAAGADRGVLVPALIDAVSLPVRFRIIETADLVGWQGRRDHIGLTRLITAVRTALGLPGEGNAIQTHERSNQTRAPERPIAVAEVETGESRGRSIFLTEGMTSVTIGRSRDCDFVIDDDYISRSHCRLEIQPSASGFVGQRGQYRFMLIDFGSAAGTIVNNMRVDRVELRDGDRVLIGRVRLTFRILDEGAA